MKLDFNPALNVEASIIDDTGVAKPLAGEVFYILEKDPDELLKGDITSEIWYAKTKNALRNNSLRFFIPDSRGKAEIKDLKTGTYYICGVTYTQQRVAIWNVVVKLKSGKNNLILDNSNRCR